jgi:CheY-like chemotaxis protein
MLTDRTPRLLIVDDEEPVRRLLERMLQVAGYDVTVAEDAHVALERAAAVEPFDLLVSDLIMPGMQGDELARRLRQQTPGLKVLYVTGFADRLFAAKQVLWEDEAFLEKPFTQASLGEAVSLVLFGHTRGLAADQ